MGNTQGAGELTSPVDILPRFLLCLGQTVAKLINGPGGSALALEKPGSSCVSQLWWCCCFPLSSLELSFSTCEMGIEYSPSDTITILRIDRKDRH